VLHGPVFFVSHNGTDVCWAVIVRWGFGIESIVIGCPANSYLNGSCGKTLADAVAGQYAAATAVPKPSTDQTGGVTKLLIDSTSPDVVPRHGVDSEPNV
jgi:hypothetical protein